MNRPIKKDSNDEPSDEFLEQAASTALSTVLKIIDDDNEQNPNSISSSSSSTPPPSNFDQDIAINYKQSTKTEPTTSIWPNLKSLSIWTQEQNNAIDWNYT